MTKKFTDNQLANLYLKLGSRYKDLSEQTYPSLTQQQIYQQLLNEIYYELNSPLSNLYGLDYSEQYKVFTVLNTFFNSRPPFAALQPEVRPHFVFIVQNIDVHDRRWHGHRCYSSTNDVLFTWLLLDSLSHHRHHHHYNSGCFGSSNHHSHSSKDDQAKLFLLLVLLAALAVGIAFIAAYYLLRAGADSIERLIHDEGSLQAIISLSSAMGSALVSGFLATIFASTPLAMFALAAGITNPIGFVTLGVICLTVIGSAVGCFITNQIQNYIIKQGNLNALDPLDPHRYGLTEDEEIHLASRGFDPVKVKCAIVALHEQIGKDVSPRLHRIFSDSDGKQALLDTIRKLRRGETGYIIEIGTGTDKQTFDLRPFVVPQQQHSSGLYPDIRPNAAPTHGHPTTEYQGYPEIPPTYDSTNYGSNIPSAPTYF
ncbi:hypothetical protein [Legionella brunensis]|uniref:Uncharacterized protein n=1 Tax=Legionella brunensis TaxID=29422 RepID=A0A0W0S0R6_9GAMM|nr:hypothetical protein [Legionella brunensis]KTC77024.1 hypothetical protein Lbru_3131 [Legionella brunensis]